MSWQVASDIAKFESLPWQLKINQQHLESSLTIGHAGSGSPLELLTIQSEPACPQFVESYTPDTALVCCYQAGTTDACSLKVRYEVTGSSDDRFVLQCTIAFETRSFDLTPNIGLDTPNLGRSLQNANPWKADSFSGALLLEDHTRKQATLDKEDRKHDHLQFFAGFLERGVIRKCRFRMIVLSPDAQESAMDAEAELKRLETEPLPLLA